MKNQCDIVINFYCKRSKKDICIYYIENEFGVCSYESFGHCLCDAARKEALEPYREKNEI